MDNLNLNSSMELHAVLNIKGSITTVLNAVLKAIRKVTTWKQVMAIAALTNDYLAAVKKVVEAK